MSRPLLLLAALMAAGCTSQGAERAAMGGVRNGLIGAAVGAVAGAVTGNNAGRSALQGGAIGATAGVVTAVVDDFLYEPAPEYGYGDSGDYDWGPYPYDPVRAEAILAEDRYSPDAIGAPVAYPYGRYGASPAGVVVATNSPRPRDTGYRPYPLR